MGKDQNGALLEKQVKISYSDDEENIRKSKKVREKSFSDSQEDRMRNQSRGEARESSDSDEEEDIKHRKSKRRKRKSRKRYSSEESDSGSESEYSSSASESESSSSVGSERRRRKRRERRRRREKDEERERKRRKREKEKKRRKGREEERKKKDKTKKKKERGKTGAVTNSWGKYGVIKETDMWNKRPEFTAWLAEVKQVNLEHLSNWEEKQMFKEFMEDHNTATFPSKKYYNLDQYHRNKIEKAIKKGMKKVPETERTVFNDEEQRRQELMQLREKKKEEEVESLKREMQSGLAQAMKEQAQLREEMAYQYKIGNFEAAAAIQRRLDPDVPM